MHVYNSRYHSIGLKVKEQQESDPGRQSMDRREFNGKATFSFARWRYRNLASVGRLPPLSLGQNGEG